MEAMTRNAARYMASAVSKMIRSMGIHKGVSTAKVAATSRTRDRISSERRRWTKADWRVGRNRSKISAIVIPENTMTRTFFITAFKTSTWRHPFAHSAPWPTVLRDWNRCKENYHLGVAREDQWKHALVWNFLPTAD